MGVKQREPLSPLLFILFINDMSISLYDDTVETISIDELHIFLLLFADDTVLFSYTPQGLQTLLNKLHAYCLKWNVNVNINKTVALTFKKRCRMENVDIYYNNERLKNVGKFTYLGVTLSANGKVYQAQKTLSKQAMKALFSVNSLFDSVSLNVSEKIKVVICGKYINLNKVPKIKHISLKFNRLLIFVILNSLQCKIEGYAV